MPLVQAAKLIVELASENIPVTAWVINNASAENIIEITTEHIAEHR